MLTQSSTITERLSALRAQMSAKKIDAYIVTNNDPHGSEYSADHWLAREWISGFTGSAGDVVITGDGGGLWTDGRYYIQGSEQIKGTGLTLFKAKQPETPSIAQWLADSLPSKSTVGVDGRSISQQFYLQLKQAFKTKSIELVLEYDLLTPIWSDRPDRPSAQVFNHPVCVSGIETIEKIAKLQNYLIENQADALLVSTLDDVMWALNIRGADTTYCPISESYLLVEHSHCRLFIDQAKVTEEVRQTLSEQQVHIHDYTHLSTALNLLDGDSTLIYSSQYIDAFTVSQLKPELITIDKPCIVTNMKAQKNSTELTGMQEALKRDGAAVVKFMHWLDHQVPSGHVTELNAEQTLMGYRTEIDDYIGDSFRTIAGFAEHGAKMHYAADEDSNYTINEESFFLVDSGGQYLSGTTDITRTFHFGSPSQREKRDYTLVLKAVIRLSQAQFLKGATGANLDVLARGVLWQAGIDYKCGTGHGVGVCLNVHEGPQNFSQNPAEVELKPGMVITNEPGVYREGEYGIRIENIMKVAEVEENEFGTFFGFETITFAPIATHMLDIDMLEKNEKQWLNNYHQSCYQHLVPYLDAQQIEWLEQATQSI